MMNRREHDKIEEWAKKYAGLALMGFLCTVIVKDYELLF